MKILKWMKKEFTLKSLNKKLLLLSKSTSLLIIIIYLIFGRYFNSTIDIFLVILILLLLIYLVEYIIHQIIILPIRHLDSIARKMAMLDFSEYCSLHTGDEFEELGRNLNIMANNLQKAIVDLENTNKRLEEEVNQKKALLEQRKELVDTLAHEMKTPLGVIQSYGEGILDSRNDLEREKYIKTMIEAGEEITELINTLLDLSGIEARATTFQYETFDFTEFVETIIGKLLIDIPDSSFQVEYNSSEDEIIISFDTFRMKQVLDNLILNARNHVTPNGKIEIMI
ncbi:MAG: histidine kinase dimerization/phospho-acceptor domain-containing protein, partial [Tissierellia bacterium]|nr:histidine kinase dimerization/phospho-acceptor domain-containing protein [Tissierellia bacterium]